MDLKRHEWFRNTSWNSETEAAFFKKLARARDKSQYLRIQACTLADRCPEVALRLLDQYFATGKHFGVAQAHVDRATAYRCLNQLEAAIVAYEAALDVDPTLSTQAYVELPFLIATERLSQHYDRAISAGGARGSPGMAARALSLELRSCAHSGRTGRPSRGSGSGAPRVGGFIRNSVRISISSPAWTGTKDGRIAPQAAQGTGNIRQQKVAHGSTLQWNGGLRHF